MISTADLSDGLANDNSDEVIGALFRGHQDPPEISGTEEENYRMSLKTMQPFISEACTNPSHAEHGREDPWRMGN